MPTAFQRTGHIINMDMRREPSLATDWLDFRIKHCYVYTSTAGSRTAVASFINSSARCRHWNNNNTSKAGGRICGIAYNTYLSAVVGWLRAAFVYIYRSLVVLLLFFHYFGCLLFLCGVCSIVRISQTNLCGRRNECNGLASTIGTLEIWWKWLLKCWGAFGRIFKSQS